MGDGLLVLGRYELAERPPLVRPIAEEAAAAQDQPDEASAVGTRVKQLDVPSDDHPAPAIGKR